MENCNKKFIETGLMHYLDESPCNFYAVNTIRRKLEENGFEELNLADSWTLRPSGRYYVVRNNTAIFAFIGSSDLHTPFLSPPDPETQE